MNEIQPNTNSALNQIHDEPEISSEVTTDCILQVTHSPMESDKTTADIDQGDIQGKSQTPQGSSSSHKGTEKDKNQDHDCRDPLALLISSTIGDITVYTD